MRTVPRSLAARTAAAMVLVDHVTKDTDSWGRFAIGGQAKMAGLDGATAMREVLRAQIVLFAADGQTNAEIAGRLNVCADTVRQWRRRFTESGLANCATGTAAVGHRRSPRCRSPP